MPRQPCRPKRDEGMATASHRPMICGQCSLLASILMLAVSGCAPAGPVATTPSAKQAPASAASVEAPPHAIAIVFLHEFDFAPNIQNISEEDRIVRCVAGAIRGEVPGQRIVSFDAFRRAAFPELPREAAPRSPEYLTHLLKDPTFTERVAPLELRYLLFVGGTTHVDQVAGGFSCVGGYPYAACAGYWQWEKTSHIAASLMDFRSTATAKAFETTQAGTAWLAVVQIFPVGMPAATESAACTDIGRRVGRFLRGMETEG